MVPVGLLQPLERLGLVSKARVDEGDVIWRHIAPLRQPLQFSQHLLSLGSLARRRIGMPESAEHPRLACRKTHSLLALCNGFLMPAHLLISRTKIPVRHGEVRVHLETLAKLFYRLVVP